MTPKNLEITLLSSHWITFEDDEDDLCAHGQVRVKVGTEIIVDEGEKEDFWTTSAMAVHLLRTLEENHTPDALVGEHLIPCCGHFMYHIEGENSVHMLGCMTGHNFWVEHKDGNVLLTTENDIKVEIPFEHYKNEVLLFTDSVEEFYKTSRPRKLPTDDFNRKSYELMWKEWRERRQKWN